MAQAARAGLDCLAIQGYGLAAVDEPAGASGVPGARFRCVRCIRTCSREPWPVSAWSPPLAQADAARAVLVRGPPTVHNPAGLAHLPKAMRVRPAGTTSRPPSSAIPVTCWPSRVWLPRPAGQIADMDDNRDGMKAEIDRNKAFVLEAFDVLFNTRDYAAAAQYWSDDYIQHSAHIGPGRDGLFNLIRSLPQTLRYENQFILADGDQVMLYGRFSGTGNGNAAAMVTADVVRMQDGKLAEHWDVREGEV